MRQAVTIVTPEAASVVTLAEVKAFLRVTDTNEDSVIQGFLDAAIEAAKNYTRRSFVNRTLKLTLDDVPSYEHRTWWDGVRQASISEIHGRGERIDLPFPNLQSITSFTSYDVDNSPSVFASSNYLVDTANARLILNQGSTWPPSLRDSAAIEIVYVSGYGAAAGDVPAGIKTAIKQHAMEMYEMRQYCEPSVGCRSLLRAYRIIDGLTLNG